MRFLHTADWQIGLGLAQLAEKAGEARKRRVDTARNIAQLAQAEKVDFALIAGDTFEHNGVSEGLIREIASVLSSFGCPVYVLPGNHDPAGPGSVWERPFWRNCPNVVTLTEPRAVALPGGTLFACPARDAEAKHDPTEWIPSQGRNGFRIGLAHGSVLGNPEIEVWCPIPRNAPELRGLDYLALGHWHSTVLYRDSSGALRMAYSGTPEPSRFGEADSGNVLLVEIPAPGAEPRIETRRVAGLQWLALERTIRDEGDVKRLLAELESLSDPGNAIVECRLRGMLRRRHLDQVDPVQQVLESRFFFGRLNTEDLLPEPEDLCWTEDLPAGYLRRAAKRLVDQARRNPEPAAVEALRLLYRGLREVQR
jgi:DNA repair exonuclease SbcCD nuclease subunit